MPIITLTTDMGTTDHYVAVVKAAIYRHHPEAVIVDISHHVRPFNAIHAAFTLRMALNDFPKGTVHVVGVRPERTPIMEHLAVEVRGQYIIGADNGMFPLLLPETPDRVHALDRVAQSVGQTAFVVRDIFSVAACHLARGGTMEVLGQATTIRNEGTTYLPVVLEDAIRGMAVHVDHYGNVITNIDRTLFDKVRRGRPFEIRFRRGTQRVSRIHAEYGAVEDGDVVAMFGSPGLLQISINGGSASQLLGLRPEDIVSIEFRG